MEKKNKSYKKDAKMTDEITNLRKRAEEMLIARLAELDKMSPADVQRMFHELQVHQIELEMHNEELRRTQQELEASREKYFDLYDRAPVGYVTLNEKGLILEANLTVAALLGKERSDLVGRPITRFISREDQDIYYHCHKQLLEKCQYQECVVRMQKGDGTRLWARLESIAAKGHDGEAASRMAIIDITRIKQTEEELDRYREHLEDMIKERTSELEVANEQLDAFNYSVSHDLRSPLRHMRGFFQLLQKQIDGQLDEKSHHYALSIFEAIKKMEHIINALLSFSRIGCGEIQTKEVNLGKIVKEGIGDIFCDTPDKTNKRQIQWKIGDLPNIYGDPILLKLAIVNLISNAIKFTSTRPNAEIEIGCKEEVEEFVFFVKDNGVGFNMDYSGKLFGLFQRLHTQSEFEGDGIGLANVRRIVSCHGGRVWAEGAVDQGATFYLALPRSKAPIK